MKTNTCLSLFVALIEIKFPLKMQDLITHLILNYSIFKKASYPHNEVRNTIYPSVPRKGEFRVNLLLPCCRCHWFCFMATEKFYKQIIKIFISCHCIVLSKIEKLGKCWIYRFVFLGGMVEFTAHWVVLLMIYHVFCTEVEMYFKTSREITGLRIQRNCTGESHACWNEQKLLCFVLVFLRQDFVSFLQPPYFWKCRSCYLQNQKKKFKWPKCPGINWMLSFCVLKWEQTNAYCTCNCSSCGLKYVQYNCQKE